jgi:hypothetical protein
MSDHIDNVFELVGSFRKRVNIRSGMRPTHAFGPALLSCSPADHDRTVGSPGMSSRDDSL